MAYNNFLFEFIPDHLNGRVWNAYDLTSRTGKEATGDPAVYTPADGGPQHIYTGQIAALIEFIPDGKGGQLWNAYNASDVTGQPVLFGVAAVYTPRDGRVPHIYTEGTLAGVHLLKFIPDSPDGQLSHADDLTDATGVQVNGKPAVYTPLDGSPPRLYIAGTAGNLLEFIADDPEGLHWHVNDLTAASDGPGPQGDPAVYTPRDGSPPHIYICDPDWHLFEFVPDYTDGKYRRGKSCNARDLTAATGFQVGGFPAVYTPWDGPQQLYIAGRDGHLLEFFPDDTNGQHWHVNDLTAASNGPLVIGTPAVYRPLDRSKPQHIYITSPTWHLWEFTPNHTDGKYRHATAWNKRDLTAETGDFRADGNPAVYTPLDGSAQHVYVTWSQPL